MQGVGGISWARSNPGPLWVFLILKSRVQIERSGTTKTKINDILAYESRVVEDTVAGAYLHCCISEKRRY